MRTMLSTGNKEKENNATAVILMVLDISDLKEWNLKSDSFRRLAQHYYVDSIRYPNPRNIVPLQSPPSI